ncbi:MAG TPA: hypothetical protein VGG37_06195 [Opitutaceae bacterium]
MRTPSITILLAAAACLGLSGCLMQPSVAMSVTTADGQKLEVPLTLASTPVTDGRVTLDALQFAPWEIEGNVAKSLAFSFIIQFKPGDAPSKIVVEDDTELPILLLFEDDHPKLVKDNMWAGVSRPFGPSDEHVAWVNNVDNNVRIYRATVTLTDGSTHVLLKPVFIPGQMKIMMRKRLGLSP